MGAQEYEGFKVGCCETPNKVTTTIEDEAQLDLNKEVDIDHTCSSCNSKRKLKMKLVEDIVTINDMTE
jgi:hypothetical protein